MYACLLLTFLYDFGQVGDLFLASSLPNPLFLFSVCLSWIHISVISINGNWNRNGNYLFQFREI